jgi:hypothetical protein
MLKVLKQEEYLELYHLRPHLIHHFVLCLLHLYDLNHRLRQHL